MDAERLASAIHILRSRQPFHPFTLVLNNGSRLEGDHPQAVTYRAGTGVHLGPGGVPTLFDADGVTEVIGDLSRAGGADAPRGAAA